MGVRGGVVWVGGCWGLWECWVVVDGEGRGWWEDGLMIWMGMVGLYEGIFGFEWIFGGVIGIGEWIRYLEEFGVY